MDKKGQLISKLVFGSGLMNIGNSCFFNATLQALFHVPTIAKFIEENIELKKSRNPKCQCSGCAFLFLYQNTQSSKLACNPRNLYKSLRKTMRLANILNYRQQDAHEFLLVLSEEMNKTLHSAFSFENAFNTDIMIEIRCSSCQNISKLNEQVEGFELQILGHKSIESSLNSYFQSHHIKYTCNACKKENSSEKNVFLLSAPRCILLALKRFSNKDTKTMDAIEITKELKISKYFSEDQGLEWKYKLVAVVNHVGTNLKQGHYTTICYSENDLCYLFDDNRVQKIDGSQVKGQDVYMLFYELTEEWNDSNENEVEIIDDSEMLQSRELKQERSGEQVEGNQNEEVSGTANNDQMIPIEIIDENQSDEHMQNEVIDFIEIGGEVSEEILSPTIINEEPPAENVQSDNKTLMVLDKHEEDLSGRRIIDMKFLIQQFENMTGNVCRTCNSGNMEFIFEDRRGLNSTFFFRCNFCDLLVPIKSQNNSKNINEAAVVGIVSIGLGYSHLQEFLTHLDVKCMSYPTYYKFDKRFQTKSWKLAKSLEEEALMEEIRLAIENGDVDSAANALIVVEFDGSWGKRSYNKNYSSLSGCATIIGLRTKKILYSGVKNKYCHTCKIAASKNATPKEHECNANYVGPSSGMETEIIIEGFKHCAEKGARFHRYIGDGDSSTYKALRDLRLYRNPDVMIEKFECVNHLFKNFIKKFIHLLENTKFKLAGRKLINISLGRNICVGVRMAVKYWIESDVPLLEKYTNLESDVLNSTLHYLGFHDKCKGYFCAKNTEPEAMDKINILKATGVYYEIMDYCQCYFANNVKSLIANYSTNKTEGFHSQICKTLGGKRVCNSTGGSYKSRTALSDIQYNTNGHSGSTYHEFAFGEKSEPCLKLENARKRKHQLNAIAQASKPKNKKSEDEPPKKKKKRVLYGAGHEDVDFETSAYQLAKNRLLERLIENQMNRDNIQKNTIGQRHILEWMEIRRDMLTSSYFGRILNAKSRHSYTTIVYEILHKNNIYANTADIRHQRMFELEALQIFNQLYKEEAINQCGIFIDRELCFLGASPFRLYGEDALIVVKCPKVAFEMNFDEAIAKNKIQLFKSRTTEINFKSSWYQEIQGQLRITGRRFAYLVIYLGEAVYRIIEKIPRDDSFWKDQMEEELKFFYEEAMIKEIVDSRADRGMDLRKYNSETKTFE